MVAEKQMDKDGKELTTETPEQQKRVLMRLKNAGVIRDSVASGKAESIKGVAADASQSAAETTENLTLNYEKIKWSYSKVNIDGKTYNQVKAKEGDSCNKKQFKTDSIILKRGVPVAVECVRGKIKRAKTQTPQKIRDVKSRMDSSGEVKGLSSGEKPSTSDSKHKEWIPVEAISQPIHKGGN